MLQHTRPVEKETSKGMKCKAKDDHLHFAHNLDTLHSFKSYVCKQNLISSSAHTVRTTHTRKIGLTAFDTKWWSCEDTVHTHSYGHKTTMPYPKRMSLVNKSRFIEHVTGEGVFTDNDLPAVRLESGSDPYWGGFSEDCLCDPSL